LYANLHSHSDFSNVRMLDSINKVDALIKYAGEIKLSGIALTDHECVSSWIDALNITKKLKEKGLLCNDFKTILGNEIYLIENREEAKDTNTKTKFYHAILLAKNLKGNEQIRRLSSIAWDKLFSYKGMERVPIEYKEIEEVIGKEKGNLIFSTACLGSFFAQSILNLIANPIEENKYPIHDFINWCMEWFGKENVFIEIQPNPENEEQLNYNKKAIEIAKAYELKWIATTDAHFLKEEDREIHKAYLNSSDGDREIDAFYKTCYLMSYEEIKEKLCINLDILDVELALSNTNIILNMCEEYTLDHPRIVPEINIDNLILKSEQLYKYTEYEYIQKFVKGEDKYDKYLIKQLEKGIEKKGNCYTKEILERLNIELDILWAISEHTGDRLSKYFIVAQKLVEIMWDEGDSLVGAGRGSIGGFYLGYLLDIHQVDSIKEDMPYWRFMNKGRLDDYPDADIDSQTSRRKQILLAVKNYFGYDKVLNIITFGTEASKSALLTACRGLGIDTDIAQFLSNMIPVERGKNRSLDICINGNPEEKIKSLMELINELDKYPKLKETAMYIEGLINKRSTHASGVYIYNDIYWKHNSLMRSPSGLEVTAFTMQNSDIMGGLKFDFLSIEALDVIRTTLDLLIKDKYIQSEPTLKQTYDKYIHPDVLDYKTVDMWNKVANREILKLFQFETDIGGQCAEKAKPLNLIELTTINSLMRLMTENTNTEQPIDRYLRFRNNVNEWYKEMDQYGLTENEQILLKEYLTYCYGVSATQEDMMRLVMDKNISNFSMKDANRIRKGVSKKSNKIIDEMKELFFTEGKKVNTSDKFLKYVWDTQIQPQCGYSFSYIHAFEYALIALQEMNLASKYPILYWNTACLSVDASADDEEDEKSGTTNYGKVATAISNMQSHNVKIALPDINTADFGFKTDIQNNQIIFGLKGIHGIGDDVVKAITNSRPYQSIQDFLNRMVFSNESLVKNGQMVQLIKAGCFDTLEKKDRKNTMKKYINQIHEPKQELNFKNIKSIIESEIIPEEFKVFIRYYNFKKHISQEKFVYGLIKSKRETKKGYSDRLLKLDSIAYPFYQDNFSEDNIVEYVEDTIVISENKFNKEYDKEMNVFRDWLSKEESLHKFNDWLYEQLWNKYGTGTIPQWEMDSLCFYYTGHELDNVKQEAYNIVNFFNLSEEPKVVDFYTRKGIKHPKFEIVRIAGTVLDKNKYKHTITLLTTYGVVTVKYYEGQFNHYNRQISQKNEEGSKSKKTVLEKSWFTRGEKLLIAGYRRGSAFRPHRYVDTVYSHTTTLIENILADGQLILNTERVKAD